MTLQRTAYVIDPETNQSNPGVIALAKSQLVHGGALIVTDGTTGKALHVLLQMSDLRALAETATQLVEDED